MQFIHYRLGLLSKRYRLWYWKTHNKNWMWGIFRAVDELPVEGTTDHFSIEDFNEVELCRKFVREEPKEEPIKNIDRLPFKQFVDDIQQLAKYYEKCNNIVKEKKEERHIYCSYCQRDITNLTIITALTPESKEFCSIGCEKCWVAANENTKKWEHDLLFGYKPKEKFTEPDYYKLPGAVRKKIESAIENTSFARSDDGFQIFRTRIEMDDMNKSYKEHIEMIARGIVYSKRSKIPYGPIGSKNYIHCISGFLERTGRLPYKSDIILVGSPKGHAIDIIKQNDGSLYFQSEIDFIIAFKYE
jgi:hypothetical protein